MHFWPKFGNTDFNWWWLFARTSSKWGKFWLLSSIWHWSSRSIVPKIIGILTKVFYISGPNLVILAWVVDELLHGQADDWRTDTRTHTHTHTGNDNTRRPKLASGKKHLKSPYAKLEIFFICLNIFNDNLTSNRTNRIILDWAISKRNDLTMEIE